jgi:hypothetical protein
MKLELLFSVYCCLFACSCCKAPLPAPPVPAIKASNFAMRVGTTWTYQRVELGYKDTLQIHVIRDSADVNYYCLISKSGITIDSGVYSIRAEEISYHGIHPSGYSAFGYFILKMPAQVGSKWQNDQFGEGLNDSSYVISHNKDVQVLGKKFDAFFVKRLASVALSYQMTQTCQISDSIGLISQSLHYREALNVPQQQSFQLMSYDF